MLHLLLELKNLKIKNVTQSSSIHKYLTSLIPTQWVSRYVLIHKTLFPKLGDQFMIKLNYAKSLEEYKTRLFKEIF